MTKPVDVVAYNAAWLEAWTKKDVERLLGFYAPDVTYMDPQTASGIVGHDALRAYLTQLFNATPPMRYDPEATWRIEGGFCGRWYCTIGEKGEAGRLRGFDLVLLRGDQIVRNEVYVHQLPPS